MESRCVGGGEYWFSKLLGAQGRQESPMPPVTAPIPGPRLVGAGELC